MNSVTNHHAGTKAGQAARCALRSVLACALVFGASGTAFAQQYGDRQFDRHDDPAAQQQPARGERGARYLPPERDPRYDVRAYEEQRRAQQQQQQFQEQRQDQRDNHRGGAVGRMTPDERRDLRRQINEAGMDLYPPRR
jgi:uncharacterized protein HemX